MKKIIALVLTLTLALSASAFAFANEIPEVAIEVFEGPTYEYAELGFSLTIPEVLAQTEVPAEVAQAGVFDMFATADNSATIQLLYIEFNTSDELSAYIEMLKEGEDVKDFQVVKINDAHWMTYSMDDDVAIAATDISETALVTAIGAPAGDEGFMAVFMSVLGSIAPLE